VDNVRSLFRVQRPCVMHATLLYAACRVEGIPRLLQDVIGLGDEDGVPLTEAEVKAVGKSFQEIKRRCPEQCTVHVVDPAEFLPRLVSTTKSLHVLAVATRLCDVVKTSGACAGKNPAHVVAAF
jgi:transcription initiation factor TFIIIB Brf1 subunit/transcription initiation factor TFIIB